MRIKLTIEYDGTAYAGWQFQRNGPSIQEEVERAIAHFAKSRCPVTGASRTDAGVHARGNVAHFDTQCPIPPDRWFLALNTRLPEDIRVVQSEEAPPDFHARFHARRKQYTYRFYTSPAERAIGRQYAWRLPREVDVPRMNAALRAVLGTHDFRCMMASGAQSKTTVREIYRADVKEDGNDIVFSIEGNGFLYNMVRILAGTLVYIGTGKLGEDALARAIEANNRLLLGPTAPARGLCLEWVSYEDAHHSD